MEEGGRSEMKPRMVRNRSKDIQLESKEEAMPTLKELDLMRVAPA